MNARSFALISGALAVGSLCAQTSYPSGTIYFQAADYSMPPAVGAPYCDETRIARTVTQPDGTQKIVEYAPIKTCRDSAGRTRSEVPVYLQPEGPQVGPLLIQLRDPVAAAKFVLYAVNKTVYRQSLPPNRTVHLPALMPIPADGEVSSSMENLGTQIMEGLVVEGRRYTHPPGPSGNDLTVTRTVESWWSPELAIYVLEKTSDPVKGELISKLTHVTRSEPDPDLFRLPLDYTLMDKKTGDFVILWGQ
jgi:hypothetical protein